MCTWKMTSIMQSLSKCSIHLKLKINRHLCFSCMADCSWPIKTASDGHCGHPFLSSYFEVCALLRCFMIPHHWNSLLPLDGLMAIQLEAINSLWPCTYVIATWFRQDSMMMHGHHVLLFVVQLIFQFETLLRLEFNCTVLFTEKKQFIQLVLCLLLPL